MEKHKKLKKLLQILNDVVKDEKCILFTLYKKSTDELFTTLENKGFYNKIAIIHGNKKQNEREKALSEFHQGKKLILLTTDVCARGIF
jgi:ATP-dependent RNA helicase RhlE